MIGWLILSAYLVGWFATSVVTSRWLGTTPRCTGRSLPLPGHYICRDKPGGYGDCSRPVQRRITDTPWGMGLALVWPLILPAIVIHRMSEPPPAVDPAYIARLERELGISR